ncbi:MAG: NADH-quinone oxidoreductase subunit E [Paracoccaceae bacterium]|jgi:NADH-quinone oxidoreductase subunit E
MLRRLHSEQPDAFAFTPANLEWAQAQITKFPEGRQASAIIPLLWRAQEQEGWLPRPAIEHVAQMLGLAYIRALEVATFYFMFQLQPVGSIANIQVCGTTSCMICGAEDLIAVCKEKIAPKAHMLSADGKLSWEEVECLGACSNAPMAQIGKDYYEDLTTERFAEIIEALRNGDVPTPGPQNGRYASEPLGGATSLLEYVEGRAALNASAELAVEMGDTVKRIDGTEAPLLTPWLNAAKETQPSAEKNTPNVQPVSEGASTQSAVPEKGAGSAVEKPDLLEAPKNGAPDDLKKIKGVGPKLEVVLNSLGVYHFFQIAGWSLAQIGWIDANMEGFTGRVSRDDWVAQAKILASGQETDFSERVK